MNTLTRVGHLLAHLARALPVDLQQHVRPAASSGSTDCRAVPL